MFSLDFYWVLYAACLFHGVVPLSFLCQEMLTFAYYSSRGERVCGYWLFPTTMAGVDDVF